MPRSHSGRIVLNVEPETKKRLYSALALTGQTMKDWFSVVAEEYYTATAQPLLFKNGQSAADGSSLMTTEEPDTAQKDLKVVSLFSGCGGMDLGFRGAFQIFGRRFARNPFEIVWANDLNEAACRTYQRNLEDNIRCGSIWDLMHTLPANADVVIGGFPCQDISVNGKREGVKGKRSGLYKAMVEVVTKLRPKAFVAENVKGLLMQYNSESLRQVIDDFTAIGYKVSYKLYRAADYGVPQMRERVFIVGTRPGLPEFLPPEPTHGPENWITASQAVADLEGMSEAPEINHVWSRANKSPEQGNRKLNAHRPAHTIRAECHGNIQFHYRLPRRISMREAARFQSFPDDFIFESKLRETERQVGNAVPPILAWHVARALAKTLMS